MGNQKKEIISSRRHTLEQNKKERKNRSLKKAVDSSAVNEDLDSIESPDWDSSDGQQSEKDLQDQSDEKLEESLNFRSEKVCDLASSDSGFSGALGVKQSDIMEEEGPGKALKHAWTSSDGGDGLFHSGTATKVLDSFDSKHKLKDPVLTPSDLYTMEAGNLQSGNISSLDNYSLIEWINKEDALIDGLKMDFKDELERKMEYNFAKAMNLGVDLRDSNLKELNTGLNWLGLRLNTTGLIKKLSGLGLKILDSGLKNSDPPLKEMDAAGLMKAEGQYRKNDDQILCGISQPVTHNQRSNGHTSGGPSGLLNSKSILVGNKGNDSVFPREGKTDPLNGSPTSGRAVSGFLTNLHNSKVQSVNSLLRTETPISIDQNRSKNETTVKCRDKANNPMNSRTQTLGSIDTPVKILQRNAMDSREQQVHSLLSAGFSNLLGADFPPLRTPAHVLGSDDPGKNSAANDNLGSTGPFGVSDNGVMYVMDDEVSLNPKHDLVDNLLNDMGTAAARHLTSRENYGLANVSDQFVPAANVNPDQICVHNSLDKMHNSIVSSAMRSALNVEDLYVNHLEDAKITSSSMKSAVEPVLKVNNAAVGNNITPPFDPPHVKPSFASHFKDNRNIEVVSRLYKTEVNKDGVYLDIDHDLDDDYKLCLVGHFNLTYPGDKVLCELCNKWQVPYSFSVHDTKWVIFKFRNIKDLEKVLFGGPYCHKAAMLLLRKMPKLFKFDLHDMSVLPVWVQLPNLPWPCFNPKALSRICSSIGEPVCMDQLTMEKRKVNYARALVVVDIEHDLPTTVPVFFSNGEKFDQPVRYENLPAYCSFCHKIGHFMANCGTKKSNAGKGKETFDQSAGMNNTNPHQGAPGGGRAHPSSYNLQNEGSAPISSIKITGASEWKDVESRKKKVSAKVKGNNLQSISNGNTFEPLNIEKEENDEEPAEPKIVIEKEPNGVETYVNQVESLSFEVANEVQQLLKSPKAKKVPETKKKVAGKEKKVRWAPRSSSVPPQPDNKIAKALENLRNECNDLITTPINELSIVLTISPPVDTLPPQTSTSFPLPTPSTITSPNINPLKKPVVPASPTLGPNQHPNTSPPSTPKKPLQKAALKQKTPLQTPTQPTSFDPPEDLVQPPTISPNLGSNPFILLVRNKKKDRRKRAKSIPPPLEATVTFKDAVKESETEVDGIEEHLSPSNGYCID